MMRSSHSLVGVAFALLPAAVAAQQATSSVVTRSVTAAPAFVENVGQWPDAARFRAQRGPATLWCRDDGVSMVVRCAAPHESGDGDDPQQAASLDGVAVHLGFGDRSSEPVGQRVLGGRWNFYVGHETRHRSGARGFEQLRYPAAFEGVDVVLRPDAEFVAYDLHCDRGADLAGVEFDCEGVLGLAVESDGRLRLQTVAGPLFQTAPVSWRVLADGRTEPVDVSFRLLGPDRYGFEIAGESVEGPLVVDPGLRWSSFFGGSENDIPYELELDAAGVYTVAGLTRSSDYPVTTGRVFLGDKDAMLARIDPAAAPGNQVVWSTMLGGAFQEGILDMVLAADGQSVWACGVTESSGFPTTAAAIQPTKSSAGFVDGFLIGVDGTGQLTYGSFLGGEDHDWVAAMEWYGDQLAIGGYTESTVATGTPFPTTANVPQPSSLGGRDAFVALFDPRLTGTAQLTWSTFWGGSDNEGQQFNNDFSFLTSIDLVVDPPRIAVVGRARSGHLISDMPLPTTPGAFQPNHSLGNGDMFLSVFEPIQPVVANQLVYSTYLGGTSNETAKVVRRHPAGGYVLGGWTFSPDCPTTVGALRTSKCGPANTSDTLLAWIRPNGNGAADLVYSTYIGGDIGADNINDLRIETSGVITVCGWTQGGSAACPFPLTRGAIRPLQPSGTQSGFVIRLEPRGRGARDLHYGTVFSSGRSVITGIELDSEGILHATGRSDGSFPAGPSTGGAAFTGAWDTVLLELDLLPVGSSRALESSPCGTLPSYTGVDSQPFRGNADFTVRVANAPFGGLGTLVFGLPLASPLPLPGVGIDLLITPIGVGLPMSAVTPIGQAETPLPIPATAPLGGFSVQAVFLSPSPCSRGSIVSASDRLDLAIQ